MPHRKSTVEEIRQRFDADVDRFSNLQTGQAAIIDAALLLELTTSAAAVATPHAKSMLDVGCGGGNFTLKLLEKLPNLDATLMDLSAPMLDRAVERVSPQTRGTVRPIQGDVREIDLGEQTFDIILAASVLHHLRDDGEWETVFAAFYRALRPGGSVWISDLVSHFDPGVQELMWGRYGDYLIALKGPAYRDTVYNYVEMEDTPRPLLYQTNLLAHTGFTQIEVLHKNTCFAAFGAVKSI